MEDRLMGAEFGASCARVCGRCDIIRDNPTTEELLKRAQDMIHEDQDYLKDFNAAVNQLRKSRQSSRLNILVSGIAIQIGDNRRLAPICEVRCCFERFGFL